MTETLTQEQWTEMLKIAFNEKTISHVHHMVYEMNGLMVKASECGDEATQGEYEMGRFLFRRRVNVPEMHALVRCRERDRSNLYIIMQKITGVPIMNSNGDITPMPGISQKRLVNKLRKEIKKILGLGILPTDSDWRGNSVFNPEKRRVYLFDFEAYQIASREVLDEFGERIRRDDFIRYYLD